MKSFIFPVIVALLGFALVTLADFGDSDAEEAKIIEDFENGMFDSFITIQTEVNDDDDNNDDDDDDLEDVEEPQDRISSALCRLRCLAQCAATPNGTCTCTKMFLGIFPMCSTTVPCS